jgi:calcium-dependent protein kinase
MMEAEHDASDAKGDSGTAVTADSIPEPKGDIQSRYKFSRTLGKGASCRVVEAIAKSDKSLHLAIKIVSKERPVFAKLYEAEVSILSHLRPPHENVIHFLGNEEDEFNFYILTSMCTGGELFDRIVSREEKYIITEKTAAGMVQSMLQALNFCHSHDVVHRDLKPENFVFESPAVDANLVLIDFGCATVLEEDPSKTYDNLVGTAYYLAPELAYVALARDSDPGIRAKYSPLVSSRTGDILKAADIWAIGVIAYVMLTGRAPFRGRSNRAIFESIVNNEFEFPEKDVRYKHELVLSDAFKDFVGRVLDKDPTKRLSIEECLRHPWVTGADATDYKLNEDVMVFLRQFNYQSKLKKEITQVLAANMTQEKQGEVEMHFKRLDADGDAHLDAAELTILLEDQGYAKTEAGAEAVEMIKQADHNQDGVIDFEEFKAIWYRRVLTKNDIYIHRVFGVFDKNGDGQIELEELEAVLIPFDDDASTDDMSVKLTRLKQMIEEVDQDKDGKISFAEFSAAMKEDIESGGFSADDYGVGGTISKDLEYARDA